MKYSGWNAIHKTIEKIIPRVKATRKCVTISNELCVDVCISIFMKIDFKISSSTCSAKHDWPEYARLVPTVTIINAICLLFRQMSTITPLSQFEHVDTK